MTGTSPEGPGRVTERRLLVTGGSSGLGAAVVEQAISRGYATAVLDRKPPDLDVPWFEVDLADTAATEDAVRDALEDAPLHGLVTAAGIDSCGRLEDVPTESWERVVAVNLLGTAAVVRSALPALRAGGGRLVTVASTLGLRALPDATAYCASKFGVVGFTRALAAELSGDVGVTLLEPGGMTTAFFDDREEKYKPGPDARLNDPAHVASVVLSCLEQPAGSEIREVVVTGSVETSWP